MQITTDLVRALIDEQFPLWRGLPIRPVVPGGHDNRTFRLGEEMAVRLPSHERYVPAVEKELRWLPELGKRLSLPIPAPIAHGAPNKSFPFPWTVNRWLRGETATVQNIPDPRGFALDLAAFLRELESIDAAGGPPAGEHNFHRGGDLRVYDAQTRTAIANLSETYDATHLTGIWEAALASRYTGPPVWVHGDVAVGNLLVMDGRLCGVIDFGTSGVGDPACDYVMAWNFFGDESRAAFLEAVAADPGCVDRARGWALWKALITADWNAQDTQLGRWGRRVLDGLHDESIESRG